MGKQFWSGSVELPLQDRSVDRLPVAELTLYSVRLNWNWVGAVFGRNAVFKEWKETFLSHIQVGFWPINKKSQSHVNNNTVPICRFVQSNID